MLRRQQGATNYSKHSLLAEHSVQLLLDLTSTSVSIINDERDFANILCSMVRRPSSTGKLPGNEVIIGDVWILNIDSLLDQRSKVTSKRGFDDRNCHIVSLEFPTSLEREDS